MVSGKIKSTSTYPAETNSKMNLKNWTFNKCCFTSQQRCNVSRFGPMENESKILSVKLDNSELSNKTCEKIRKKEG